MERSTGDDGAVFEKTTKNHQHRKVTLSAGTAEVLRRHRATMVERALACGVLLPEEASVSSSAADGSVHWWPSHLTTASRRLCTRLGLPAWVKLHGLRHTQITQLLDAGVPLRTVSGRVRHRSSSTTSNDYSHWIAETDATAAKVGAERIWQQRSR